MSASHCPLSCPALTSPKHFWFLLFPYSPHFIFKFWWFSQGNICPSSFFLCLIKKIFLECLNGKRSLLYVLFKPLFTQGFRSNAQNGCPGPRMTAVTVGGDGLWLTCQADCWLRLPDSPLFKENSEYVTYHVILSSFLYVPHFPIRLQSAPRQAICLVPLSILKTWHGAWYIVWPVRQIILPIYWPLSFLPTHY